MLQCQGGEPDYKRNIRPVEGGLPIINQWHNVEWNFTDTYLNIEDMSWPFLHFLRTDLIFKIIQTILQSKC